MFQPSPADVRRFFCQTWARHQQQLPLEPLQALAADWMVQHPEYAATLADEPAALAAVFDGADGQSNPFLHLSLHLSIAEQLSIDQPPGIRAATDRLTHRLGSLHAAHHVVMECLGEMLWHSQRSGQPPDGAAYLDAVRRRARG